MNQNKLTKLYLMIKQIIIIEFKNKLNKKMFHKKLNKVNKKQKIITLTKVK